ncbi:MAG: hypothetical protein PCFJNLEI_02557 [Verrucomicrobiae bacterium]|nr:hypothetical protein [Verrucomicrobiae bacterium]
MKMKLPMFLVVAGGAVALCGCASIGPRTIARDRFEYSSAVGESWKRQTLLNIVKLRYLDPPTFVDIGQIVAGYSLEMSASVGGQFAGVDSIQGNTLTLGGAGRYTDRPTVTYSPLTGNRFIRSLMTPLSIEAVFSTIQAGWPVDNVLFSALSSINGLKNHDATIAGIASPDPGFLRVLELLRQIQVSGAVALRIKTDAQHQQTTVLTFRSKDITPETQAAITELRQLLGLNPQAQEFKLAFGTTSISDNELAVVTRSLTHIMGMMATMIEVPPEHVTQGRATPGVSNPALRIRCTKSRPADAFVAVAYRQRWFWIDDCDLKTKRAFAFMMMLFTLADSGEREKPVQITIPAQ